MSVRQFIALGTASMMPTRYRAHNSYALRWDDQLVLFDPGEGCQRGCTLNKVAIARATAVCVTHFHGDHCLGLPGVIQRRSADNAANKNAVNPKPSKALPIFYPGDGEEYFDRLRHASVFHDQSNVDERPIHAAGEIAQLGRLTLSALQLDHRDTTYGYRLQEPDGRRVLNERLLALNVSGPTVGQIMSTGSAVVGGRTISIDDISVPIAGSSMAFVMDTLPCDGMRELARDVDLLVCESTYLHAEVDLAKKYKHLTARQAAEIATEVGARRLLLTHFSARYPDNDVFFAEASQFHSDVVVAHDGLVVDFPSR